VLLNCLQKVWGISGGLESERQVSAACVMVVLKHPKPKLCGPRFALYLRDALE
jgi:hypothetical protein